MPDTIGRVEVPATPSPSGTFPFVSDYPHRRIDRRPAVAHLFGSAGAKIEQRFVLGPPTVRYVFRRELSDPLDRAALRTFWEARSGPSQPFTYNAPGDAHGDAATAVTVRFADEALTLEHVGEACSVGLEFVEVPTTTPSYSVSATLDRFPSSGFASTLLGQEHEIIPLVRIRVNESAVPDILLSDRRVTIGSDLYLERLAGWSGVNQSIGGQADDAWFDFGNADGVMRALAEDTNLRRARVEFKLFHVGSTTLVNLWAGLVRPENGWEGETAEIFRLACSDPAAALNMPYPRRLVSRRCWKRFDDGVNCPFTAEGALDTTGFPSADAGSCDKGWSTPNGCRAHGMQDYHGGIQQSSARARIKLNGTGAFAGIGRRSTTVASVIDETHFHGTAIPEIWTDAPTAARALIVAGRDESEFYTSLGIVGEGPLGSFGAGHRLDGRPHHGPDSMGLRTSVGPSPNAEPFGISGISETIEERAAGTAFIEIRRVDEKGIQPTQAADHDLIAVVSQGLGGWKWTTGSPSWQAGLTNPIWVAINAWLRHLRIEQASAGTQEATFDVAAAEAAAAYCDASVDRIVGSGSTPQFVFRGTIAEQRPFRDWLTEILANCLGYYSFRNGKLRLGVRVDSVAVEAFTAGNMLWQSLRTAAWPAEANRFVAYFGERRIDDDGLPVVTAENVTAEDEDAAIEASGAAEPLWLDASRNFVGTDNRDQAARLATTRLRELVGGVTAGERALARKVQFETTVLALGVEPGQVIRITHDDAPGGDCEVRVEAWELLPDWRVLITGQTSTDSMYDLTVGSTAADVEPDEVPEETLFDPEPPGIPGAPGPVTGLEIVDVSQDTDLPDLVRLTVEYTPPDPLVGFDGVEVVLETPAAEEEEAVTYAAPGVLQPQGWHRSDGSDPSTFVLRVPYPGWRSERWHVYAVSRNDLRVAEFRHRAETGPTPSAYAAIPANPGGITAPAVSGVTVAFVTRHIPLRARSAAFARSSSWLDIAWTLPTAHANWLDLRALKIVLRRTSDGVEVEGTYLAVEHDPARPTAWAWTDFPDPASSTTYVVRIYSINADGSVGGHADSSSITLGPVSAAPAVVSPSATPEYAVLGEIPSYRWHFAWTLPTETAGQEVFDRVEIEGRPVGIGANWTLFAREGSASTAVRTDYWPRPGEGVNWEFQFWPVNVKGERNGAGVVSVGPVTVAAASAAANVTGFTAARQATTQSTDGVNVFGFQGSWTNPSDANFDGVIVTAEVSGSGVEQVLAIEREGSNSFKTDLWPVNASQTWVIRAYAVNRMGHRSSSPPSQNVTVTASGGTLQMSRAATATLGPGLEVVSGALKVRQTVGANQIDVDGTNGFRVIDSTDGREVRLWLGMSRGYDDGALVYQLYSQRVSANKGGKLEVLRNGAARVDIGAGPTANGGYLSANGGGSGLASLSCGIGHLGQAGSGYLELFTSAGVNGVQAGVDSAGKGGVRFNNNRWALRGASNGLVVVGGVEQLSGGTRAVATGLTSIVAAVATPVSGSPDWWLGHDTPSGGSVTFLRNPDGPADGFFSYIVLGVE